MVESTLWGAVVLLAGSAVEQAAAFGSLLPGSRLSKKSRLTPASNALLAQSLHVNRNRFKEFIGQAKLTCQANVPTTLETVTSPCHEEEPFALLGMGFDFKAGVSWESGVSGSGRRLGLGAEGPEHAHVATIMLVHTFTANWLVMSPRYEGKSLSPTRLSQLARRLHKAAAVT